MISKAIYLISSALTSITPSDRLLVFSPDRLLNTNFTIGQTINVKAPVTKAQRNFHFARLLNHDIITRSYDRARIHKPISPIYKRQP